MVNILSFEDFQSYQTDFSGHLRVVFFYTPFDGRSSSLSPRLFSAAKQLASDGIKVKIAKIDITRAENKEIPRNVGVSGFPLLVYFLPNTGLLHYLRTPIAENVLVREITRIASPLLLFQEVEEYDEYFDKTPFKADPLVIGKFSAFEGEDYLGFIEFARNNSDYYRFAAVLDSGQWSAVFEVDEDAIIIATSPLTRGFRDSLFTTSTVFEELSTFVEENYRMCIGWITKNSEISVLDKKRPIGILLGDFEDPEQVTAIAAQLYPELAPFFQKRFQERRALIFLANRDDFLEELRSDHLEGDKLLYYFKVAQTKHVLRYRDMVDKNGEFQPKQVAEFSNKYYRKELRTYMRSDPVPANKYENGVRVAVGDTVEDILAENDIGHLFVIYTMRDIGLVATAERLANEYEHYDKLEVVKIEATNNELPKELGKRTSGVLFVAKGGKYPKVYPGNTLEFGELTDFLREQQQPTEDL